MYSRFFNVSTQTMETTAEATSTNTTKPVIWWQGPLINAWSPGKVIAWERGFVSPQEKVQNLCGVQLVE